MIDLGPITLGIAKPSVEKDFAESVSVTMCTVLTGPLHGYKAHLRGNAEMQ